MVAIRQAKPTYLHLFLSIFYSVAYVYVINVPHIDFLILLISREDIFPDYTVEGFEAAFSAFYDIEETRSIESSSRRLYRMRRK